MVQKIIDLVHHKNHFLEKFFSLNDTQITGLMSAEFQGLEHFYQARENLLKIIGEVDQKLSGMLEQRMSIQPEDRHTLRQALDKKDHLVKEIISQDLKIMSLIQKAKDAIISELKEVRQAKQTIGKYRSRISSNIGLDDEL